jgi:hypothetical protein
MEKKNLTTDETQITLIGNKGRSIGTLIGKSKNVHRYAGRLEKDECLSVFIRGKFLE